MSYNTYYHNLHTVKAVIVCEVTQDGKRKSERNSVIQGLKGAGKGVQKKTLSRLMSMESESIYVNCRCHKS